MIIGGKVWCHMCKNAHKYLAFHSVILLKACTVQDKGYTFPIQFFQKTSIEHIILNVKQYNFLTLKKGRYLHLCKFHKKSSKQTREIAEKKRGKIKKVVLHTFTCIHNWCISMYIQITDLWLFDWLIETQKGSRQRIYASIKLIIRKERYFTVVLISYGLFYKKRMQNILSEPVLSYRNTFESLEKIEMEVE